MAGAAAVAGGAGGARRAGASLVTVDVLTGHICSVSFCLHVPTERDKRVWLVQSRRRPVDQDNGAAETIAVADNGAAAEVDGISKSRLVRTWQIRCSVDSVNGGKSRSQSVSITVRHLPEGRC